MIATSTQPRFAGVVKIVRFNVQFYLVSALTLAAVIVLLVWRPLPQRLEIAVLCGGAAVAFWTLSSLLVSWYVYDHAGVTRWQWLPGRLPGAAHQWVNIHAGLDESTAALRQMFPGTDGPAIDIYESAEMTEPSISRARRLHPSREPAQPGRYNRLPVSDHEQDAVFLLFAAHEVRDPEHRTQLLRETARALGEGGYVVIVEHLRDWKNFAAFGPGFLHFHSRRNWLRSIRAAGLFVESETQVTPFVRCFVLRAEIR